MMRLIVYQSITIHSLSVQSIANSSVLQIGSAGMIKPLSNRFHGGGAPALASEAPLVPLPEPADDPKNR